MDLELSDDQFALRDGIRSLLTGRFDSDRIRAGYDRALHEELAEAGVFSLLADGFTWADAAVVFEQLGEFCVPGPLVASFLAGEPASIVEAHDPTVVEYLDSVDAVYVLGADVARVDAAAIRGERSEWPLDPLVPVHRVAGVEAGAVVANADVDAWRSRGAVLTAAFCLGLAAHLAEISVEYAKNRVQFDRPVGSFQALKHMLADMAVRVEVARAAVYAAAAHLDDPDLPGLSRTVGVAKALAGEAAILNGKTATQVHGGMGFTWEVDVHLYLKRAWVLDTHFGSADSHCDAVAATLH